MSVAGLWDTTDMKPGEETEVIVQTSLRELIVYLVFLAILIIGTKQIKYSVVILVIFKCCSIVQ